MAELTGNCWNRRILEGKGKIWVGYYELIPIILFQHFCWWSFLLPILKSVTTVPVFSDGNTHTVIYEIASSRPQKPWLNHAVESTPWPNCKILVFISLIRHFCWLQSLLISPFVQCICLYFSWDAVFCTVFINTPNHMHWLQKKIAKLVCFFFPSGKMPWGRSN